MTENLIIRKEQPEDYKKTELMTMRSFWNKFWPGCTEHYLVRIIRESKDYLPELSRVAELRGRIVGAIFYTRAWIDDGETKHEIVTIGPLAVEPTMEGKNIGGTLLEETIDLCKKAGVSAIALVGEKDYYPRFGFERASKYGITDAFGNSFDEVMILPLSDAFTGVSGKLTESSDFEKLDDTEKLKEVNKEFPKYRKVKIQEGFMKIGSQHIGVVDAIEGDMYMVRYWDTLIPTKLADGLNEVPEVDSDVFFVRDKKSGSKITKVVRNLLRLRTERTILRPWEESDAESLFHYASNPDVGPIAGWPPHQSVEESRDIIKNVLSGPQAYAICRKEDEKPFGCIELKLAGNTDLTDRDDECEMGFWIGKPFWGRGFMTEAAREMIRHAFEDCGMNKIWCGYYEGNSRSKRLQEKLGFVYQWTTEEVDVPLMHETRTGHVNLMTREDWEKAKSN